MKRSHLHWSWILMIAFLLLSVIDYRFSLLGLICMISPLVHSLKGLGKIHCTHYCPRGSLLGRFLKNISIENPMPSFMHKKWFKNSIIIIMASVFTVSVVSSNGDPVAIGFALFRLVAVSSVVSLLLGIYYKPRTWCVICPMGHSSTMINNRRLKKLK